MQCSIAYLSALSDSRLKESKARSIQDTEHSVQNRPNWFGLPTFDFILLVGRDFTLFVYLWRHDTLITKNFTPEIKLKLLAVCTLGDLYRD